METVFLVIVGAVLGALIGGVVNLDGGPVIGAPWRDQPKTGVYISVAILFVALIYLLV